MRLEAIERAFLVGPHQPRVARHIGGEDRGETAFDGLFHGLPCRADHNTTVTLSGNGRFLRLIPSYVYRYR